MFWQECLVGTLIDLRRFSVETMQRLISISWRLRDSISVVGRDGSNYIVHFNNPDDHRFMLFNGPWSIDGALLIFELWEPNRPFSSHYIFNTPIWVQLWGLLLEYQQPMVTRRIAHSIGDVFLVDWDYVIPRNIRFMRVRVWINPNNPLLAGCMIKRDDGVLTWIKFRYKKVYKVCKRCGIIGHSTPHCPHSNPEIERMNKWKESTDVSSMRQVMTSKNFCLLITLERSSTEV